MSDGVTYIPWKPVQLLLLNLSYILSHCGLLVWYGFITPIIIIIIGQKLFNNTWTLVYICSPNLLNYTTHANDHEYLLGHCVNTQCAYIYLDNGYRCCDMFYMFTSCIFVTRPILSISLHRQCQHLSNEYMRYCTFTLRIILHIIT